jgi:hypothetical protein
MVNLEIYKERLLSKRLINNNCWLWQGYINNKGYGTIHFENTHCEVHRLAFRIFRSKEFKEYLNVCHRNECKNRHCFNPEHLYAGTQKDNVRDDIEAGTHISLMWKNKTHCPQGHEYTIENTYIAKKTGCRQCKICRKNTNRYNNLLRSK